MHLLLHSFTRSLLAERLGEPRGIDVMLMLIDSMSLVSNRTKHCVDQTSYALGTNLSVELPRIYLIVMEDVAIAPPPPAAMTGIVETSTNGLEPIAPAPTATPPEEAENACETLYIQNLNEKIKTDGLFLKFLPGLLDLICVSVLKASLRGLFKSYGEVLDVVAHGNLRMRGQAFVSFASTESATKAMKDIQRFPLYSKPMVCRFVSADLRY
jgi:RNA recognition motif. (a.k.a. RRM, RBD, or RNP domain)